MGLSGPSSFLFVEQNAYAISPPDFAGIKAEKRWQGIFFRPQKERFWLLAKTFKRKEQGMC